MPAMAILLRNDKKRVYTFFCVKVPGNTDINCQLLGQNEGDRYFIQGVFDARYHF